MRELTLEARIEGCLLGGALGDAIGANWEGEPPDERSLKLPARLTITDDTQLTLATCEAIISTSSVDPESVAERFLGWFRERRLTGIGASTLKSLIELDAGGHWATVGASGERAAGNGAAMRIAPLAFLLDADDEGDRRTIRDVCRITHRNDEAYVGGLAVLRSIRCVLRGDSLEPSIFDSLVQSLPDSRVRDRLIAAAGQESLASYHRHFACSGYVVDSVPAAILASIRAVDYRDGVRQIVSCGGDTDTIASMYGQIFGAANGPGSLPAEWLKRIDEIDFVRDVIGQFQRRVKESSQ